MKDDVRNLIEEARKQFVSTQKWIYMDVAARGIISKSTRDTINDFLDDVQNNGGTKDQWFKKLESTRNKMARLISADSNEIAITKNVSEGLNIIANAFPWEKGDNVIVCREIEHPNNVYVWTNLAKQGVEVRFVTSKKGLVKPEDFIQKVDKKTRMVSVSSVSFVPGQRIDIKKMSNFCRKNDIFLLVDSAQSCGILDINVKDCPIDAMAITSYKGLLGLYGMGFLYCRKEWIERLHPVYLARYSIDLENDHEEAIGGSQYQLHQSGKRFEIGNYNFIGSFAANASLDLLLSIGVKNIERHVLQLSKRLTRGLEDIGMIISSGRNSEDLSNIVTIGEWGKGDHYMTDDPELDKLYNYLLSNKIKLSIRRGLIRFSLHLYNTTGEVDYILDLIDSRRKSQPGLFEGGGSMARGY